ncbi:MAG: tetratricopeptide repeat protein [Anaerolineae bacterium]|nr:tetratricopeptide repeat protein [Anaerolineae bacterium]
MGTITNTVFISYQRGNIAHAVAIFQMLHPEYDVFLDYEPRAIRQFTPFLENQIKSRTHYIVVVSNSSAQIGDSPDSCFIREVQTAIDHQRHLVPIFLPEIGWDKLSDHVRQTLSWLPEHNPLMFSHDFRDVLRERLNTLIEVVSYPIADADKTIVTQKQNQIATLTPITQGQLDAEKIFEDIGNLQNAVISDELLAKLEHAVLLDPNFDIGYANLAVIYNEREDYDRAVEASNRAIELNPQFARAYLIRANAFTFKEAYHLALQDVGYVIQHYLTLPEGYYSRGLVHLQMKKFRRAIIDYNRAIQLNPNMAVAYSDRGIAYLQKRRHRRAIQDFDKAISLEPQFANAYYHRGLAYVRMGGYASRGTDFTFGLWNIQKGQPYFDQAIADFNQALEINPKLSIYAGRGVAHAYKGDSGQAILDFNRAIEINPNDVWALQNRGVIYAQRGDYDRAIEDYERVLTVDPKNRSTQQNLVRALHGKNQP